MKLTDGVFIHHHFSCKEEDELRNSFINEQNILSSTEVDSKENLIKATEAFLSLPVEKQLHIIHSLLDLYGYTNNDSILDKNIEAFLGRPKLDTLRNVIYTIVNDYWLEAEPEAEWDSDEEDLEDSERLEKLKEFENELGIKIVISDKDND